MDGLLVSTDPAGSLTQAEELRLWKEYHDKSVGRSDLLHLLPPTTATTSGTPDDGPSNTPNNNNNSHNVVDPRNLVKSELIIDNLRLRAKAKQPYTALGQSALVVVNPYDREQRVRVRKETTEHITWSLNMIIIIIL